MAPDRSRPGANDDVIYEMVACGGLVRVTAMHPGTLTEVIVHGPASAGPAALRRLAQARLEWVLERRARPHP